MLPTLRDFMFINNLLSISRVFTSFFHISRERYSHIVTPLLVHAQRRLLDRISYFGGPPDPQPHFIHTETINGRKVTTEIISFTLFSLPWKASLQENISLGKKNNSHGFSRAYRRALEMSLFSFVSDIYRWPAGPMQVNSCCFLVEMVGWSKTILRNLQVLITEGTRSYLFSD